VKKFNIGNLMDISHIFLAKELESIHKIDTIFISINF
tara:strand:+ start:20 stop:130 length:111 start_codon:yes stop_codon:yes gene_type:complete